MLFVRQLAQPVGYAGQCSCFPHTPCVTLGIHSVLLSGHILLRGADLVLLPNELVLRDTNSVALVTHS